MNRTLLTALIAAFIGLPLQAQSEGNPFQSLGYKASVATFSDFEEFHDQSGVVQIGSVWFDTTTDQVVGIVQEKNTLIELVPDLISTTIDPHCEKYYSISPYAYCFNNPVRFIDPDGRDSYEYNMETRELVWINDKDGKDKQHIDFINGNGDFVNYASINGENAYVYALKDGHVVTNFDANFNDRTYNTETGYEYSINDFMMRNEIVKDQNPIGTYIYRTEREGRAEPITRRDAENTYGTSLLNFITLGRAVEMSSMFVGGGITTPRSPNGLNMAKSLTSPAVQTGNSWNNFLKANKGKYSGKDWIQKAAKDYYNSPYYRK